MAHRLRITKPSELEHVSPSVRKQLANELHHSAYGINAHVKAQGGRLNRPEQEAGAQLVTWMDTLLIYRPSDVNAVIAGDYFAHSANGGARTAVEGAILKGQGVRKGWPDYTFYWPVAPYCGLVLELKAEHGGKPDKEQLEILARLEGVGYKAVVAWGFDDARRSIELYLD